MPLILPGNVASATAAGYEVANSCRFDDGDSPKMVKQLGTPSSQQTFTLSTWFKLGNVNTGANRVLFCFDQDSNDLLTLYLHSTKSQLALYSEVAGSAPFYQLSNAVIRDPSAWYHVAAIIDGTDGTQADRLKIYLNGTQITSWATDTQWSSVANIAALASGNDIIVGAGQVGSASIALHWEGYLAETVYLDGTAAAIGDLGEFDSDSPTIWKPKDVSGLTFGNNGFYCDYEASGNLGNDANGGTDLTETNIAAVDQATDTPTNNFCTLNPIYLNDGGWSSQGAPGTFSQGNMNMGTAGHGGTLGTIGTTNMKFYFEVNIENNDNLAFGVIGTNPIGGAGDGYSYDDATVYGYYPYGTTGQKIVGGTWSSDSNFKDAGLYHFAVDPTNNKMWIGKDGTWDGDPAAGSGNLFTLGAYEFTPWIHAMSAGQTNTFSCNFGGCSGFTVSSANADDDGYGNFEFDVPAGFYALCTKNLAEYG